MGARILRAIARDEHLALMRCQQRPQPDNNPTVGGRIKLSKCPRSGHYYSKPGMERGPCNRGRL
eukprot:5482830-Karenia_brevis.AAC.1